MDLQGNKVDFNRDNGEKIDCSNWKNGVYILNIANDSGTIIKKLIVSH
jgi:hypothetical protein